MNENQFYISYKWMATDLNLKGIKKEIYAIIYGFCKDDKNKWLKCTLSYFESWTLANKSTIINAIKELQKSGLIIKKYYIKNDARHCKYKPDLTRFKNTTMGVVKNNLGGCKIQTNNIISNIVNNNINSIALQKWILYKKEQFNFSYKETSLKTLAEKLEDLSNYNPKIATKIIDQSIENGWKGLFKLKEEKKEIKEMTQDELLVETLRKMNE